MHIVIMILFSHELGKINILIGRGNGEGFIFAFIFACADILLVSLDVKILQHVLRSSPQQQDSIIWKYLCILMVALWAFYFISNPVLPIPFVIAALIIVARRVSRKETMLQNPK